MLLTIDVGNTNIKFAVYEGKKKLVDIIHTTNSNKSEDEYYLFLKNLFEIHGISITKITAIIVASVVPQLNVIIERLSAKYFSLKPIFINQPDLKLGLKIKIDVPQQLGMDIVAGSIGAIHKYGNNLLVVDFGTATTFALIGDDHDFLGGVIAPGINTSIKALHHSTALLPLYEFKKPNKDIPTSTEDALSAGIFYGYIGLVKEIISKLQAAHGKKMTIIAVGGESREFKKNLDLIDHYDSDLVLEGLRIIYEQNR